MTNPEDEKFLTLPDEHWDAIKDLVPILEAVRCAASGLSADVNVFASVVYPIIHGLIDHHLTPLATDVFPVAQFREAVAALLRFRLMPNGIVPNDPRIIASLLDPRHKQIKFASLPQRKSVENFVEQLITASVSSLEAKGSSAENKPKSDKGQFLDQRPINLSSLCHDVRRLSLFVSVHHKVNGSYISREEWFDLESLNFTRSSVPVWSPTISDMKSLPASGWLQNAIKYCRKVRKTGVAGKELNNSASV